MTHSELEVAVSPLCSCNVENETIIHFLCDCINYSEAKSQLLDAVNKF